jgi:AAA domain-containing protein
MNGDEREGFGYFELPPDNGRGREEPNRPGTPNDATIARQDGPLIQTSAEFVANFTLPDYLIDGLIQRRFVYSLTAPTNAGKTSIALRLAAHVALALKLANREVEQGKVLVLVGENQDDSRMRWIKLCEELGREPNDLPVYFLPSNPRLSDTAIRKQIDEESAQHGPFVLVIVDTSVAYFEGDDENNNVQAAKHARMLRSLTKLPDGPTIIVTCHPTKNADSDNLVPRGGGAFLNEIDTNLVCVKEPNSMTVQLHWHRKVRGVDFAPIPFELKPGTTERLTDSKGRPIWTVTARPISTDEQTTITNQVRNDEDRLLVLMNEQPGLSLADMAGALNWSYSNGEPNKTKVDRLQQKLSKQKLVKKTRDGWQLTKEGEKAAQETPLARAEKCM